MPLEWDGDNRMDLLVDWTDGAWRVLRGTSTGLSAPVHAGAGGVASGLTSSWTVADLDGDGRDDLVRASSNPRRFYSRLNSSTGFTTEGIYNLAFIFAPAPVAFPASTHGTTDSRRVDFDNDGREDFAVQGCEWDLETTECIGQTGWWMFLSDGDTLHTRGMLYRSQSGGTPAFGDFNADHLTDIVYCRADGTIYVALSRGRTGFTQVAGPSAAGYLATDLRVADYDGDGYDDLLLASNPSPGTSWWHVFRGTGAGLSSTPVATAVPGLNSVVADVNGDGLADLARAATNGAWSWYPRLGVPGDMLARATDGFGVSAEWTRAPMSSTSVYKRGTGAAYPMSDLGGSRPLVSKLRQSGRLRYRRGIRSGLFLRGRTRPSARPRLARFADAYDARRSAELRPGVQGELFADVAVRRPARLAGSQAAERQRAERCRHDLGVRSKRHTARQRTSTALLSPRQSSATTRPRECCSGRRGVDRIHRRDVRSGAGSDDDRDGERDWYRTRFVADGARLSHRVMNDTVNWCLGRPTMTQTTTGHTAPGGTRSHERSRRAGTGRSAVSPSNSSSPAMPSSR